MPVKYVPFVPEPIEGQAVLGSFKRILKYKGADDAAMLLTRGMPLYEVERTETVGSPSANMLIRGECVSACAYLKERDIRVDLVYIDPPFASGADYAKQVFIRRDPKAAAAAAQAGRELDMGELRSFEEKMYGDVWDKEKYLNWMYENLMAIKGVMNESASIYVHLDWHIGHYVKILMDEIFGEENFQREIIWQLHGVAGYKSQAGNYVRAHDTIFYYTLGPEPVFNKQYLPYSAEQLKRFSSVDEHGRRYKTITKERRLYLDEAKGIALSDVWDDIASFQTVVNSPELCGYATQKPEALLERIIRSSSNEGMVVADFFGGSGVTAAAAHKLGRSFIHCDVGLNSIQTARDRLKAGGASFDVLEIKDGVQLYRNPVQTMDKLKSLIPGLKSDNSLGAFWAGAITDNKLGTVPVYLPNLLDSSSKLLDVVTVNRIIRQAIPELDSGIKKVIVYYIDVSDEAEIRKFIAADDSTDVEIELRDLKDVLDDVVAGDYAELRCENLQDGLFSGYAVTVEMFASDRLARKIDEFNEKAKLNQSGKKPFEPITVSDAGLELIEYLSLDCTAAEGEWHSDSELKIDKNGYVILNGARTRDFWDGSIKSERRPLRLKIRNICGDESVWELRG